MYPKSSNYSFSCQGCVFICQAVKAGVWLSSAMLPRRPTSLHSGFGTLPVSASALCGGGVEQLSVSQQGPGCWGAEVVSSAPGTGCAGSSWGAERAQRDSWAGQEVGQLRQQASGPHVLTARKDSSGVNLASPYPAHTHPPPAGLRARSCNDPVDHSSAFLKHLLCVRL